MQQQQQQQREGRGSSSRKRRRRRQRRWWWWILYVGGGGFGAVAILFRRTLGLFELELKYAALDDDDVIRRASVVPPTKEEEDDRLERICSTSDSSSSSSNNNKNKNKNKNAILTEECMQYNARRIARAFPLRPKQLWCVRTTTASRRGKHSKNDNNEWQGLLYIKVPKVSSSTLAGVALRIHNHTQCEVQWEHKMAYKFKQRSSTKLFLLGSMRKPSSRDLSHIQFFIMGGGGGWWTNTRAKKTNNNNNTSSDTPSAQDFFDHGLYWTGHHSLNLKKGKGGYQTKWLSLESIPKRSVVDDDDPNLDNNNNNGTAATTTTVKDPPWAHSKLQNILQQYHFFIVVERMDESLVALSILMDIPLKSVLVAASAKVSDGSYSLVYRGRRAGQCVQRNTFPVPQQIYDHMKQPPYLAMTYLDQILYRAINISLDWTIQQTIGSDKFQTALSEYRYLKQKAIDHCGIRLTNSGYANGTKIVPVEPCYVADFGCGYQCLDEVTSSSSSSSFVTGLS